MYREMEYDKALALHFVNRIDTINLDYNRMEIKHWRKKEITDLIIYDCS